MSISLTPTQKAKLKTMLVEMTHCMQRADNERDAKKEIANAIEQEFGLKKKQANKMARTMYKQNYADLQEENREFEDLYETLVEGKKVTDQAA